MQTKHNHKYLLIGHMHMERYYCIKLYEDQVRRTAQIKTIATLQHNN